MASNRDLLSRQLRREGHRVVTAESGLSALARLAEDEFDLILLDILMPDMNGIEMLSRLKSEERWQHVPVIMISGLSDVTAVARCIEAGADDYLTKPFNPILLRARINSTLEKKRWLDREHRYLQQIKNGKAAGGFPHSRDPARPDRCTVAGWRRDHRRPLRRGLHPLCGYRRLFAHCSKVDCIRSGQAPGQNV
ncbi:response regulator (plasmid) [Sinorhizobium meliloti]|nr:response regulator [Sinorhizobium meliloti]